MARARLAIGLAFSWSLCATLSAGHDVNILRNASFEEDAVFNGGALRQGSEFLRNHLISQGKCAALPVEGWLVNGASAEGASIEEGCAKSGKRALRLAPKEGKSLAIFSSPEMKVAQGPVTLSAWIDASEANLTLEIEFTEPYVNGKGFPKTLARKSIQLPAGAKGWTRLELSAEAPKNACASAWLKIDKGSAVIDDVQLEEGAKASPFEIRKEDAMALSFEGFDSKRIPFWTERPASKESFISSVFGASTKHAVELRNASFAKLEGELELWLGPWSKPKTLPFAKDSSFSLEPGATAKFNFDIAGLEPDAYAIHAVLKRKGLPPIDGESDIDASARIAGAHSAHMLKSRDAIRFAIAPIMEPKKIYGVANGMLSYGWANMRGDWSGGWPIALLAAAKGEGFVCGRDRCGSDEKAYLFAAAGVPVHRMEDQKVEDGAPKGAAFIVPGTKSSIDIWSEEGMKLILEKAGEAGKFNAGNPLIASYQMSNESFFPYRDGLCPTANADASFRAFCKREHGSLDALNKRWGTNYASWEDVEQPASAAYAAEVMARPKKEGAANTDWTAALGNITPEIHKRILSIPGRGMDWLRWRTESSLKLYKSFRDEARKYDSKTLYGTNLCWPNFWPQMFIPFLRQMDLAMLDVQYTSGMERALGNPSEMLEILEMAESCAGGKPVWGIEIYAQPQWEADFAPLQNWGLAAHGMSNNLVFAWGPYSDHGIPKEAKAWERKDAVPMWMLIDLDGSKLPAYYASKKSQEEIKAFHGKYDALSLARAETKTAFYVSSDTAEFTSYESANKPWDSCWTRTRNTLCYLLRMEGVRLDFVDDETLPSKPGRYESIVVPASYALSQEAAGKIASFVKSGGTAVLAGPSGIADKWLAKSECLGGEAWAELDWKAPKFETKERELAFAGSGSKEFKGAAFGQIKDAAPLMDSNMEIAGWKRKWGDGLIVAYGVLPDSYAKTPRISQNLQAWTRQLVEESGLKRGGRWTNEIESWSGEPKHGHGSPVVEVVVRERRGAEKSEKFAFILNQGGEGAGFVEIPVGEGVWRIEDALSGESLGTASPSKGDIALRLSLKPWGYKVLRLARN